MSTRCKGLGALLPVAPSLRHLSVSPVLAISCAAVLLSPSWSRAIGVHCACEATAFDRLPVEPRACEVARLSDLRALHHSQPRHVHTERRQVFRVPYVGGQEPVPTCACAGLPIWP